MNTYTIYKKGLMKITIIGLILIGVILGNCGVINLAYAEAAPFFVGNNSDKYIQQESEPWQSPSVSVGEQPLLQLAASLSSEEEQINSLLNKIKSRASEERKRALEDLIKIIKDSHADLLFKENAIGVLVITAKDNTLDSQTKKDVLSALFNTVLASGLDEITKEKAMEALANIADTSSDPQTRMDAFVCLQGLLDFSQVSDGLKQKIVYQSEIIFANLRYVEARTFVAENIKIDSSVSEEDKVKFIGTVTEGIFMSGRADYLKETLDYTTFKKVEDYNGYYYDGDGAGTVFVINPEDMGVSMHEVLHSFWFHHDLRGNTAMQEGFAIAAAEVIVNDSTNLAENVFGTKLWCRDIGNNPNFPLGADTIRYADETLAKALDYLQGYDNTGSGFNWQDESLLETYYNTIWANLDRERENYFSEQVPWAIEQMDRLNQGLPVEDCPF